VRASGCRPATGCHRRASFPLVNGGLYWVALAGKPIDAPLDLSSPEVEIAVSWQAMDHFQWRGGAVNCGGRVAGR